MSSSSTPPTAAHAAEDPAVFRHVRVITVALALSYMSVAISLPVISILVVRDFGLSNGWGGFAVGASFLATILTRGYAGTISDRLGGKTCLIRGLGCYVAASLVCLAAALPVLPVPAAYAILIAGRLLLGLGESMVVVGNVAWGIGLAGVGRAGKVMAWIGMGMYGAYVLGSPLGLYLHETGGFALPMIACAAASAFGWLLVRQRPAGAAPHPGNRESFIRILGRIWRLSSVVGLQGVGFAVLGAFVTLYFLSNGWDHAGLGLSLFGAGFVISRILFGHLPDRIGGARVAMGSLAVEAAGQYLLWLSPSPSGALLGCLMTGLGCSMVFPAMGTEVVKRVPPQLRGTAIGGFAAFQDLSYGASGPVVGIAADHAGYGIVFLIGAIAATIGLLLAWRAWSETRSRQRDTG